LNIAAPARVARPMISVSITGIRYATTTEKPTPAITKAAHRK